tara:strand:+ start:3622 stop:4503 length:882 start_codon:yes stop_codon:yes gene_type:complete
MFNGKRSRPIPNSEVFNFVGKALKQQYLYDKNVVDVFLHTYHEWLQSSKLNTLHGLDKFDKLGFVHGTSQAFDFFYAENKDRRMRCFKGDFIYHGVTWRNNYPNWKYLEDDEILANDAVIISLPFSDYGAEHPDMQSILDKCDELHVPVFVDCAYYSIARNINFDLNRECIKGVTFSLSKAFYGAERVRIGIRCKKEYNDDPVDLFTSMGMISKISAGVGLELCNEFSPDYNHEKYRLSQIDICKKLNIEPSDCVQFGITDENHKDFGDYDRGSRWRRVCISKLLSDMGDDYE